MKPAKPQTLEGRLASLSRRDCLQLVAYVQRRQANDAVILGLLQARLASLIAAPAGTNGHDTLLTVPEAAKKLKLGTARIYELIRQHKLPKVAGLGTQVRIPASALSSTQRGT
jgi:excisionase family DNA binding protein